MRLLVTGPTAELTADQQDKLLGMMKQTAWRWSLDHFQARSRTLLHSGRSGVEAAAVEIANELGWEVMDCEMGPGDKSIDNAPDHALVIWPNYKRDGLTEDFAGQVDDEIDDLADAGIPVDVRHL